MPGQAYPDQFFVHTRSIENTSNMDFLLCCRNKQEQQTANHLHVDHTEHCLHWETFHTLVLTRLLFQAERTEAAAQQKIYPDNVLMDSRLIYITGKHLASRVHWLRQEQSEWIYCGLSDDFKDGLVEERLRQHFQNSSFFIVLERSTSRQLLGGEVMGIIKQQIETTNFILWSSDFSKAMEFSKIGVFRYGSCSAGLDLAR
jgi:hypothetical protein